MDLRTKVRLLDPLKGNIASLVAIIGAGSVPNQEEIRKWYGDSAPRHAYLPLETNRYIFLKEGTKNSFVIIPEKLIPILTRVVA